MLLDTIHSRQDLLDIPEAQLGTLCDEIRQFLCTKTSAAPAAIWHPTSALSRRRWPFTASFDTSRDRLVFDVGHQCYVHKMLTGRMERFDTLRQQGGFPAFRSPVRACTTRLLPVMHPTLYPLRLVWPARAQWKGDYHVLVSDGRRRADRRPFL